MHFYYTSNAVHALSQFIPTTSFSLATQSAINAQGFVFSRILLFIKFTLHPLLFPSKETRVADRVRVCRNDLAQKPK